MAIESVTTKGTTMVLKISSGFGATEPFRDAPHTGIDIPLEVGTELGAIGKGVIERIIENGEKIGNGVVIRLEDGTAAIYGHLDGFAKGLSVGDKVEPGQLIAYSGNTGFSTGPHLHFGLQAPNGDWINPEPLANAIGELTGPNVAAGGIGDVMLDKFNEFSDWAIQKEVEFIIMPLVEGFKWVVTNSWQWFVANLPEIIGYGTMATGIFVILAAMSKGNIIKPLGIYAAALIGALCILAGN